MRNFRKLEIWHMGMEIVELTYELIRQLPSNEKYGLHSQMSRAAVSIPSNIAEGCGRESNIETARYIEISIGSAFELETQVLIGQKIKYFKNIEALQNKLTRFQKAASSYRRTLLK